MVEPRRSGQSLDRRFTLIRLLGQGGMGEVWLARDERSGREVAAKILPAGTSEAELSLLEREYRNLGRLTHPNIVPVLGFHGMVAGPVLVMEAVHGTDAGSLKGRAPKEVLEAAIPIADALAHAHEMGLVHRDLKPSNVLIDEGGSPRIVDFGIAGILGKDVDSTRPTSAPAVTGAGSRWAASPEQLAGAPPHPADDAWGLGALLEVLIGGVPPGEDSSLQSPWPIPDQLHDLVTALKAPTRENRLTDMNEIRRNLEEVYSQVVSTAASASVASPNSAKPPPALTPPPRVAPVRPDEVPRAASGDPSDRSAHRARWATWAAFGLLGVIAIFVFFLLPDWVQNRDSTVPPTDDHTQADPRTEASSPPVSPAVRPVVEATPEPATAPPPRPTAPQPERPDLPTRSTARTVGGRSSAGQLSPFDTAMSEGLAAIDRGDYAAARESFARAKTLDPQSDAAAEGLIQAEEAHRLEATRRLSAAAAEHEAAGRWPEALADYNAILALDPALKFALDGQARTRERKEITEGLAYHLAHLDRLSSAEVRRTARELIDRAERIEPAGARMVEQTARLERQLGLYSTPVPVVLISDTMTSVVIYKVGRQGTFSRKELELRPGDYTVVGTRSGYRDVRKRLVISPGASPEPLTVRCEETI